MRKLLSRARQDCVLWKQTKGFSLPHRKEFPLDEKKRSEIKNARWIRKIDRQFGKLRKNKKFQRKQGLFLSNPSVHSEKFVNERRFTEL
jgi:hypothetical protein